jgi:hypothetical protein
MWDEWCGVIVDQAVDRSRGVSGVLTYGLIVWEL